MNPWPVYEFIKRFVLRNGRFPREAEIRIAVPGATLEEIREGIAEANIQYEREWKGYAPRTTARRQWA